MSACLMPFYRSALLFAVTLSFNLGARSITLYAQARKKPTSLNPPSRSIFISIRHWAKTSSSFANSTVTVEKSLAFALAKTKCAATCSEDGTLRIWQVDDGKKLFNVNGMEGKLASMSLGSDGILAVGGESKRLYLVDFATGKLQKSLSGPEHPLVEVVMAPEGFHAAAIDDHGYGYGWDLTTEKCTPLPIHSSATGPLAHIRFSRDGHTLWATGQFEPICRWSADDWQPVGEAKLAHPIPNAKLIFSADAQYLFIFDRHKFCTARWNAEKNNFDCQYREVHVSSLPSIEQVATVGIDYIALCAGDGAIEFWRGNNDQFAGQYPCEVENVTAVGYCGPSKYTLTGRADGSLSLWAINALRERPEDEQYTAAEEARHQLQNKEFDKLTDKFEEYLKSRGCFWTSSPTLFAFHLNLNAPPNRAKTDWPTLHEMLDQWHNAKPDCVGPLTQQAEAYLCEAWEARGSGFANTITEEGGRIFAEKLKKALEVIEEGEKLKQKDPELSRIKMVIYKAVGERQGVDAAFKDGTDIDPYYFPLYEEAAVARLPRWGGTPGELASWAADTCDKLKDRGDEVYAHIALSLVCYNMNGFFDETLLDWPRIKRGTQKLLETYDDSNYVASHASLLAALKLDREILQATLPIIYLNRFDKAVWGSDEELQHWRNWIIHDRPAGQEQKLLLANIRGVDSAGLSGDGKLLLVAGNRDNGYVRFFDTESWQSVIHNGMSQDFAVLAVHPKELRFFSAGGPIREMNATGDGQKHRFGFEMWSFKDNGIGVWPMEGHTDRVQAIAVDHNAERVASGGKDKTIRLWPLPKPFTSEEIDQPGEVVGLAFSAEGKTLAVATEHDGVSLWDVASKQKLSDLPDSNFQYSDRQGRSLAFSHSGSLLTYLNANQRLVVFDTAANSAVTTLPEIEGKTIVAAFSSDDKLIATAGESMNVQLWDALTGKALHTFEGHFAAIHSLCFLPGGDRLISVSDDCTIRVWNCAKFAAQ